jgi:hypothetical protein
MKRAMELTEATEIQGFSGELSPKKICRTTRPTIIITVLQREIFYSVIYCILIKTYVCLSLRYMLLLISLLIALAHSAPMLHHPNAATTSTELDPIESRLASEFPLDPRSPLQDSNMREDAMEINAQLSRQANEIPHRPHAPEPFRHRFYTKRPHEIDPYDDDRLNVLFNDADWGLPISVGPEKKRPRSLSDAKQQLNLPTSYSESDVKRVSK